MSTENEGTAGGVTTTTAAPVAQPAEPSATTTTAVPISAAPTVADGSAQPGEGATPHATSPGTPPAPSPELEAALAKIAELEKAADKGKTTSERLAEVTAQMDRLQGQLVQSRARATAAMLESAGVPADVLGDHVQLLGDIDVATDKGSKKVADYLKARPSLVARSTAGERVSVAEVTVMDEWRKDGLVNVNAMMENIAKIDGGTR